MLKYLTFAVHHFEPSYVVYIFIFNQSNRYWHAKAPCCACQFTAENSLSVARQDCYVQDQFIVITNRYGKGGLVKYACLGGTAAALLIFANPAIADVTFFDIDPLDFDENSHIIDNVWSPFTPGEQMSYTGTVVDDEGEQIEHNFVDTVTDLTKTIHGIRTRISLEEDYEDGVLIEQEIAFHAQDKDGNIWHLGQVREVFDEIEFVGSRVWFVGLPDGAKAGIRMEAEPKVGGPGLSQGYAPPPFNWTDSGMVSEMGLSVSVPAGDFDDVMVIDEWDLETDEGIFQTKYYAKGVGLVQIGYKGDDPSKEELFLVEIEDLDDAGMERARAIALKIDGRAYSYAETPPAERTDDGKDLVRVMQP